MLKLTRLNTRYHWLNRIVIGEMRLCNYSDGSGGKNKKDEDVKDELADRIKPLERPCGNLHGTDVLSEKQRAHEKEYFYKEEREQIKALKKKIKEEGGVNPPKKK